MDADEHEITLEGSIHDDRNHHQPTGSYPSSEDDTSIDGDEEEPTSDNDNNGIKISYPSKLTIRRVRGGKRRR